MSEMRIHAALDYNLTMEDAYRIVDATLKDVEVFEVGTPFLHDHYGLHCVRAMRANYPGIYLYVDTKIGRSSATGGESFVNINGNAYDVAAQAFEAGGDIVTVLAYSDDKMIEDVVLAAKRYGGEVLADLMEIDDVATRAKQLEELGVDYVSANKVYVNRPVEEGPFVYQPLVDLAAITPVLKKARTSIQGGVTLENIRDIAVYRPSLICIGRGIYAAEDPRAAAAEFRAILDEIELG
ncbi:MAG: orotidine 5'-phosphate decarboxylase [Atopobiaceae bacterium]|nr:orotidine 5'-phosphate decarboxylase [Atopobiaceae bacterium]